MTKTTYQKNCLLTVSTAENSFDFLLLQKKKKKDVGKDSWLVTELLSNSNIIINNQYIMYLAVNLPYTLHKQWFITPG